MKKPLFLNLVYWLIVFALAEGVKHEAGIITAITVILIAGAIRLGRIINNSLLKHILKLQERVYEIEENHLN